MAEPSAPLVIIGAGGFARETARAALDGGWPGPVLGYLDDSPAMLGTVVGGLPVLGPVADAADLDALFVIATGRPDNYTSRPLLQARLGLDEQRYARVVHPGAHLSGDTEVGRGSVILAGVTATAGVRIGAHVAVMPHVLLTHDCQVRDHATLAGAVSLAGGVTVGSGAYLGAGSLVREGLRVGDWAMIGMGSLVLAEVPERRLWFGRPASDRGPSPAAGFIAGSSGA